MISTEINFQDINTTIGEVETPPSTAAVVDNTEMASCLTPGCINCQ